MRAPTILGENQSGVDKCFILLRGHTIASQRVAHA